MLSFASANADEIESALRLSRSPSDQQLPEMASSCFTFITTPRHQTLVPLARFRVELGPVVSSCIECYTWLRHTSNTKSSLVAGPLFESAQLAGRRTGAPSTT